MSDEYYRRSVLKSGCAAGTTVLFGTGIVGARRRRKDRGPKDESDNEPRVEVTDVRKIGETDNYVIRSVTVETEEAGNDKPTETTKYTFEDKETGEISYLDEGYGSEISTQDISDSVEAVDRVHKNVDTVGSCNESWAYSDHHKAEISVDFKQKVNDIGLTTAAAILASVVDSMGLTGAILIGGATVALVSDTSNVSLVFEETDFSDKIWTYCYITDGWREYDTDDMTLFSKEETVHFVPPSI